MKPLPAASPCLRPVNEIEFQCHNLSASSPCRRFGAPLATIALNQLEPGVRGNLSLNGAQLPLRLLELGFVEGTEVEVVRRAPFGDPIELELRGYRVCVRAADLEGLEVTVAAAPE